MEGALEAEWMSVKDVAKLLAVDEETVRRWIRSGQLPALSLGTKRSGYRIRRDDMERFIGERYSPAHKENRHPDESE